MPSNLRIGLSHHGGPDDNAFSPNANPYQTLHDTFAFGSSHLRNIHKMALWRLAILSLILAIFFANNRHFLLRDVHFPISGTQSEQY